MEPAVERKARTRLLLGALAVGLVARLAFGLAYWVDKPLTHDEQEYMVLAQNLRAGRGLVYDDDGREHFGRAPGYPVFLAAVLAAGGGEPTVRALQAVMGTVSVLLIAALAGMAAGRAAALLAAYLAALYPPLVFMPAYLLSETLYSLLILGAALMLWRMLEPTNAGYRLLEESPPSLPRSEVLATAADMPFLPFAACGAVVGVATLARPVALPFLALAVAFLLLLRAPRASLAMLAGAVLVIAPWTAHKTVEAGRFVLVASEGGITLWTGNNPAAIGEGDMAANPAIKRLNQEIRDRYPDLGPDQLEEVYNRQALEFITDEPLSWAWLVARKFFYTWVPVGPSYLLHSWRFLIVTWLSYLSVLPFGLAGWWRLARHRRPPPIVIYLLIGSVLAINLVFFPQQRFRVPVLDPMLLVGAAVWLERGSLGARLRASGANPAT